MTGGQKMRIIKIMISDYFHATTINSKVTFWSRDRFSLLTNWAISKKQ